MAHMVAYALLVLIAVGFTQRYTPIVVAGGSMRPALAPGDLVIVLKGGSPSRGQIVLLRSGESMVLHRVTRVHADGSVSTRGDANPVADLVSTPRGRVRGRVVGVVPLGALIGRWRAAVSCGRLPAQTHTAKR